MIDVVQGKEKPVEESDGDYEKLKHYVFELENLLVEAQKQAYRLVKRHRGNSESPLLIVFSACHFTYDSIIYLSLRICSSNRFDSIPNSSYQYIFSALFVPELGISLSDFGKAINLLGACEANALEKAFSELGSKSEMVSIRLQKEVACVSFFLLRL